MSNEYETVSRFLKNVSYRESHLYTSLYILGLNSLLNIVIPGVTLILLNIIIMRFEFYQDFDF